MTDAVYLMVIISHTAVLLKGQYYLLNYNTVWGTKRMMCQNYLIL